jgi:hypothetical protein
MILENPPKNREGSCNTPPDSQLQTHLDYLTVSLTPLSRDPNIILEILDGLIEFYSPPPVDNWLSEPKSNHYPTQKKEYEAYRTALNSAISAHKSRLSDCYHLAFNKPFKINDAQWHTHRIETKLPLSGGFSISESGDIELLIRFPGQWFQALTLGQQQLMCNYLLQYNCVPSRIDIAIDDYSFNIIPYNQCRQSVLDGNFKGFRKSNERADLTPKNPDRPESTLYLGSRKSPEMTRIYNHKGKCLRFEKELKSNKAAHVFYSIALFQGSINALSKFLGQHAIGSVDFVNRTRPDGEKETNLNRCDRLDFWQQFIDIVGEGMKIDVPRPARTLERTKNWLNKQVSGTLFAFYEAYGKAKFRDFLESMFTRHRLNPSVGNFLTKSALILEFAPT